MRPVEPNDLVVVFRIDKDDDSRLLRPRHTVDTVDLHTQDVPVSPIPRHGPALADIAEEMVLRSGCKLLDLQLDLLGSRRPGNRSQGDENQAGQ